MSEVNLSAHLAAIEARLAKMEAELEEIRAALRPPPAGDDEPVWLPAAEYALASVRHGWGDHHE